MEYAKIGTLSINTFDKNNKKNIEFFKKLRNDETIISRFQGFAIGLLNNENKEFFDHGFFVAHNNDLIGYLNISNYNEEENSVYLRIAIDKDKRGKSYGKILLFEISEYIFNNYPNVENIRLKIANDNTASLMMANACGYKWLRDDFYIKENPYIEKKRTR